MSATTLQRVGEVGQASMREAILEIVDQSPEGKA